MGGSSRAEAARPLLSARTCQNTQLTIRASASQGAAGHIAIIYRIHNLTAATCTLYGYPGVQLLDRHFLSLPTHEHRSPGNLVGAIPKRLVSVGPHGNAYFALGYSDVQIDSQPCVTAFYLMIFAPNDLLPVVTYAAGPFAGGILACSGNINVSPVTARPRYQ
jgi:hypothetical protein